MDFNEPSISTKDRKSIICWTTGVEPHKCGYCKGSNGSISHGMWAESLTAEDYQNLIDRGWRRSGNYCYKPVMDKTCCPAYTIRCNSNDLVLSKSQKKIIKKFNKYVNVGGDLGEISGHSDDIQEFFEVPVRGPVKDNFSDVPDLVPQAAEEGTSAVLTAGRIVPGENAVTPSHKNEEVAGSSKDSSRECKAQPKSGVGADPNRPLCKKAKLMRFEKKQERLLKRGMSLEKIDGVGKGQKTLEDFLGEISENSKHKFRLEVICISDLGDEWHRVKKIEFELYKKYQTVIHGDPPYKANMESFKRFLVESPLKHTPFSPDSILGFGSFHQLYWLDDKLIAVGVIDILPKCISAVYFFYDPDYRNLTLGTYGSLRELELSRTLHKITPSIEYYYMGFYIHSCPKMRYKGKYNPSFLLCPETYRWCPIGECLGKLDASKYARLVTDAEATEDDTVTSEDTGDIQIMVGKYTTLSYKNYKQRAKSQLNKIFDNMAKLVGKKCCKTIVISGITD